MIFVDVVGVLDEGRVCVGVVTRGNIHKDRVAGRVGYVTARRLRQHAGELPDA